MAGNGKKPESGTKARSLQRLQLAAAFPAIVQYAIDILSIDSLRTELGASEPLHNECKLVESYVDEFLSRSLY